MDPTGGRAVAYGLLGSLSDAEDAVQEAWRRLSRGDTSGGESLGGWLTTFVVRACPNMLRSRRTRRDDTLEPRVPDPIVALRTRSTPMPSGGPTRVRAPW
jgi:DNA-directed RNA polymerase specialized sigma24 family protein